MTAPDVSGGFDRLGNLWLFHFKAELLPKHRDFGRVGHSVTCNGYTIGTSEGEALAALNAYCAKWHMSVREIELATPINSVPLEIERHRVLAFRFGASVEIAGRDTRPSQN